MAQRRLTVHAEITVRALGVKETVHISINAAKLSLNTIATSVSIPDVSVVTLRVMGVVIV